MHTDILYQVSRKKFQSMLKLVMLSEVFSYRHIEEKIEKHYSFKATFMGTGSGKMSSSLMGSGLEAHVYPLRKLKIYSKGMSECSR